MEATGAEGTFRSRSRSISRDRIKSRSRMRSISRDRIRSRSRMRSISMGRSREDVHRLSQDRGIIARRIKMFCCQVLKVAEEK